MSDTPRTDAAAIRCACSMYVVPSEFARELERENAVLRADKERLDWINSQRPYLDRHQDTFFIGRYGSNNGSKDIRAAIDAARKEAHP